MKSVGYAVLFAALVIGAIILSNVISRMSRESCARQCPEKKAALKTAVSIGPLELVLCNCDVVVK